MGEQSKIQWTDASWNPWMGCIKVSPGCKYCYMFRDQEFYGNDPTIIRKSKTMFNAPLKWNKPALVFTCSWSDFFIEEADQWRDEAWRIIRKTPHLTYQILTKRPENVLSRLPENFKEYKNIWLGVSVESQEMYNNRVQKLEYLKNYTEWETFLSIEPLLSPIHLWCLNAYDWVIIGGESGNEGGKYLYRKCELFWIESLVSEAQVRDKKVFVKQLGSYLAKELKLKDRFGGDINEFPKHLQIRDFPKIKG